MVTCGAFYPGKVQRQPSLHLHRWLISHCPAEAQLLHAKHSCKKTGKYGPSSNTGLILCFKSNTYTRYNFMNVVLIHELLRATAMQRFLSLIFHTRSDTEIRGMLNKTNSAVTCKVHCKHSINLTTGRKWNAPEKTNAYRKKGNNFTLCWHY